MSEEKEILADLDGVAEVLLVDLSDDDDNREADDNPDDEDSFDESGAELAG